MSTATVVVDRLTAGYGRRPVVRDVSFRVPQASVYALLGRNGAGKSTLVRCLLGQHRAASGRCLLFGDDVWPRRHRLMARVGVVPEVPDVPPTMTAVRLSRFFGAIYPRWDARGFAARLARFSIAADMPFGRLSRGQKAQLALALALGSSPELVVLDDPTLGLDAVARRELFDELIGELADRGCTVLVTTHDLAGVEGIADSVGILSGGALLVDAPLETLKARFRRLVLPARQAVPEGFRVVSGQDREWSREVVVEAADPDGVALPPGATLAGLPLEDIFVAVAGEDQGTSSCVA